MGEGNTIKVYVFIARDDKEYKKYSFVQSEEDVTGQDTSGNKFFRWRYCPRTRVLRLLMHKKAFGGDEGYKILAPISEDGELAQALCEFHAGKTENKTEIKNIVELIFTDDFECSLDGIVHRHIVPQINQGREPHLLEYYIFIHWGGIEGVLVYSFEQNVEAQLPPEWHVFSIGTDRNPLFHVDGENIVIPHPQNVEDLSQRFVAARGFACAKDILTKMVVKGIDSLTKKEIELVRDCLASESVRNDLKNALSDPQTKWVRDWGEFRAYLDARPETIKAKAMALIQSEKGKVKVFVTQLLTVPQLLSEGLLT